MKIQSIAVLATYLCSAYGDEAQRERKGGDLLRELKKMSKKKAKKLEREKKMELGSKSQKLEMEEVAETGAVPGIIEMEEIESFEDEAEGDDEVVVLEELEEVVEEMTEELVAVETEIADMQHGGSKSSKSHHDSTHKPTVAKTHKPTVMTTTRMPATAKPTRKPATAQPTTAKTNTGKSRKLTI
jgi:hypothetical protein